MTSTIPITLPPVDIETQAQRWSQQMQRRVMRLLIEHDASLFHNQFRLFFADSELPPIPLLQQYDRIIKLQTLSNELLDDIMPRIRRQLSLTTSHERFTEEAPTRGEIDWPRTLLRNEQPGMLPLNFETRQRRHSLETQENLFAVAVLLDYQREIQHVFAQQFADEKLFQQEQRFFVAADERAERELAAGYARTLRQQAKQVDIDQLAQQLEAHLRPGQNPYRDLVSWWRRFHTVHIGRSQGKRAETLASKRDDEQVEAWLYELWIALEIIHLLQSHSVMIPDDLVVATDLLQCTFTWHERRFRFQYNRQLTTTTGYTLDWQHAPSTRPDYLIERDQPLTIQHQEQLIWREPPVVLDAKYYLSGADPSNAHGPIKKLLGDMTLLNAQHGALFFPRLPEPADDTHITRIIRQQGKQYHPGTDEPPQIRLYHLEPEMLVTLLQTRLHAILDMAANHLPERPQPVCRGIFLDRDTVNADNWKESEHSILCPKPHIGKGVIDLVNSQVDCLQNPLVCHVMGQSILVPALVRATTAEQLTTNSSEIRIRNEERLNSAEKTGDEERAEHLRQHIFANIGHSIERYVQLFGNTKAIEENFENFFFGPYWKLHQHSLAENTRRSLTSGEHIWQTYTANEMLQDWAAPAIQYCRTLEFELKRRLYTPCPQAYTLTGSGFTLGTITFAYTFHATKTSAANTWNIFLKRVKDSGGKPADFAYQVGHIAQADLVGKRNQLAHGDAITKEVAATLRTTVIGDHTTPGILRWLAESISTS